MPRRNIFESPSKGSVSGVVSSSASFSWVRTSSKTLLVWRPLPISLTAGPIGVATSTWTGSGNNGPRRILFGFRSSDFTALGPAPTNCWSMVYSGPPGSARRISIRPARRRGGCAATREDGGWRIEDGKTRHAPDALARIGDLARNARVFGVTPCGATAGLETVTRGRWVAGNRRRMSIKGADTAGEANHVAGAGSGLCLGRWRTVLWYQGMSRVVPEWYKVGKGVQTTFLSIANAYASQVQGTLRRRPDAECEMRTGRVKPPKATSMRHQSHPKAC